jgi:hypothetical protein
LKGGIKTPVGKFEEMYLGGTESSTVISNAIASALTSLGSTIASNIIHVDNGRTDSYTPDGSILWPYKSVQTAHDSITDSSATNTYAIVVALGLPYTGNLSISADYVTIAGDSVSKGAGYTGTITIASQHCCLENIHLNTGAAITLSMVGHFLLEIKNCRLSHATINVSATGTVAEKADTWFQVTGAESTLWLSNAINVTGVMGEAAILSGTYEGNTFTATGSLFTSNAATMLTNTFNVETGTTARVKSVSAKGNTINLKTGGTLYADITALANDSNALNNTGGTLVRVSDAQVLAAIAAIASSATGDLYYLNSSGAFTRLPIGTTGQVLKVVAGVPAWATA